MESDQGTNTQGEPRHRCGDVTQRALAYLITVGFFGILGFMLVADVPQTGHDVLLVMLGALSAAWTGVIAYYFGSSSGSATKTALLANRP